MPRLPVYEVVYMEGDEYHPQSWAIVYSSSETAKTVKEEFSTKKNAKKKARSYARDMAQTIGGHARYISRTKDGEITEEVTYNHRGGTA